MDNNVSIEDQNNVQYSEGQTPNTTYLDLPSGMSGGSDSVFGNEVGEHDCADYDGGVQANDTIPFTEAGSVMITPTKGSEFGSNLVSKANKAAAVADTNLAYLKYFDRRQAKPTLIAKGTNYLVPLGGASFIELMGVADVTALGALTSLTANMNGLIPGLETPGEARCIVNWRRIADLKNTVISYFNRSIPFTDLEASDRFAIEMCYMRDIGMAILPLYAKAAAYSLIEYWTKLGFQIDVSKFTNLQSQSLERMCKGIYSAVAALPSVDDVFMKRLARFTRLYTSAKQNGFTPTILMQDVAIAGPGRYKLNDVDAGSGYRINTIFNAIHDTRAMNGTTFMEWLEMWLRADIYNVDDVSACLGEYLGLAQSVRSNYSILLGCAMQLQIKGSVKYSTIGEFIPVDGVEEYILKYSNVGPFFNYANKERFEYAPVRAAGEFDGGTNAQYAFKVVDLPSSRATRYSGNTVYRPVGLYKGQRAWTTKEMVEIGLFKGVSTLSDNNLFAQRDALAAKLGVSLTINETDDLAYFMIDAYYGDVYYGYLSHLGKVTAPAATTADVYRTSQWLISYYGLTSAAQNAAFATVSTYVNDGGVVSSNKIVDPLDVMNGSHILSLYDLDITDNTVGVVILIQEIIALLNAADLTFYLGATKKNAGYTDRPVFISTGYRGAVWDDLDVAPVNNSIANSMYNLTHSLKQNAARRTSVEK